METQRFNADSLLTSHEAGLLLQVNPSSINNWVRAGRITAFRTPGGHLRIRAADLVQFLARYNMPIPRNLSGASKRRLLIVDDDQRHLNSLRRVFKPHAARVEVALVSNGIDALVQVGLFRPHAIILDVFMPDIDGLEVCRRLKASPETKHMQIIVSSGHLTPELEKKALKAGALRCINKPIKVETVLEDLGLGASERVGTTS